MRRHRRLPAWLASLLLLRALVPVGYMLALPGAHATTPLALELCPVQNPGLDLALLSGVTGPDHHDHHATVDDNSSPSGGTTVEVRGDCPIWQGSTPHVTLAAALAVTRLAAIGRTATVSDRAVATLGNAAPYKTRAPPHPPRSSS